MTDLGSAAVPPLRDDDHARGNPHAPLVIVYADFTCARCAVAHERLLATPIRRVYRHFALRARHPRAVALAAAAEAAALQRCFWEMHDSLFADQGHLDDPHLWKRAQQLNVELDRFEADRRSEAALARVRRDVREGMRAGVAVTPTLFVDGTAHPGPPDSELLARLEARARATPRPDTMS